MRTLKNRIVTTFLLLGISLTPVGCAEDPEVDPECIENVDCNLAPNGTCQENPDTGVNECSYPQTPDGGAATSEQQESRATPAKCNHNVSVREAPL